MRAAATLLLLALVAPTHAQVAVVHPGVRDTVDREHLRNLLLGRVTTWTDGSQVVLVLSSDPGSRAAIEHLTGRDFDRLLRGWKRILFSGNGAMPIVTSGASEALENAATRAGAIAIVGVAPPTDQRVRVAVQLGTTAP
jgi:hypothetical protein